MRSVTELFPELKGYNTDPRTRRYICPTRVVWKAGNVTGEENILNPRTSQITLGVGAGLTLANGEGGEKASILIDFGIEFPGSARMMIWAVHSPSGRANLRIRFGESVMETMADIGQKNATNDHANRDMIINVGQLSATETNESGFRFMRIDLLDDNAAVIFKSIEGIFIYRDIEYRGSFECDDELVNRIFNTAAYTTHVNMQEYFWEGIKRDRLVWIGDMGTMVMTVSNIFGYNEVVPKSLDLIRDETPIGTWMNTIPSYSIWWLLLHNEWYMSNGNLDYLMEQREYMLALLNLLCTQIGDNGAEITPEFKMLDWPNRANPQATHAGIHGMMIMAMECGQKLAALLGDEATVEKCRAAYEKLCTYIPDPNGSKQAAAFLVCSGLCDAKEMNEKLMTVNGSRGFSTFLGYYTLAAIAMAGDYKGALDCMREYWGGMLKMGATTFWEDFNIDWMENSAPIDELVPEGKNDIHGDFGGYCYIGFRHSLCHGWSSGPVPFLSRHIMGVTILEPGCKKLEIKPNLGDLKYIRGTYPTPYGDVKIYAEKQADGSVKLDISAPDEIEIEK